jgi:pyrroloquinoline quinone biosynthesis protein B
MHQKTVGFILFICVFFSAFVNGQSSSKTAKTTPFFKKEISLIILGTVQDAGSPQIGCTKDCCKKLFLHPSKTRRVVSLGLIDPTNNQKFLFEATPDITQQLKVLKNLSQPNSKEMPDGIFLTHAHIGHYTGLMYLGKEAMNADKVPVYVMPKMKNFLEQNGPWSQLVSNKNIVIHDLKENKIENISPHFSVIPFLVPHRDEFSETVG